MKRAPKKKPSKKAPMPSMSDEDIRAFVRDYCDGHVWTNLDVPEDLCAMVFMPLSLGAAKCFTKAQINTIGIIYGNARTMRSVPGRAINGFPIFVEFGYLLKPDWERARAAIQRELLRRKEIPV